MQRDASNRTTAKPFTAQHRQCPNCDLPPRLLQSFLDSRANRTVRIFKCSNCSELIWDE